MSYTKQNFKDGQVLTAAALNNIEDGIVRIEEAVGGNGSAKTYMVPRPVASNHYSGKTIACIGDSVTAGVGASSSSKRYTTLLAGLLGATEKNLGASGTVMCTGGHRGCNISRLTATNINGADIVTILMGINDWDQAVKEGYFGGSLTYEAGKTYYALGELGTDDTTTIYGAVKMWCERVMELKANANFKETKFFFCTPIITSWNNSVGSTKNFDQMKTNIHGFTLRDLCNAIIETCAMYKIPVLDTNKYSGIYYNGEGDKTTDLYFGDGIHPNDAGHAKIAEILHWYLMQNPSYVREEESVNFILSQLSGTTKLTYPDEADALNREEEEPEEPTVTNYTFTINPTPSNATVTMNGTSTKSITVTSGANVSWSVSADGYVTQTGTETVTSTSTKNVVLAEESNGDTITYSIVKNDYATYDETTGAIGGTNTGALSLIGHQNAITIVNEAITAGMEVEVEAYSTSGCAFADANKGEWSIAMLGLSKTNVIADMTMTPYSSPFPVGEANIYLDQPGSGQAYKAQYMRSDISLGKVELTNYLYPNGDDVMAVKIAFRKNADGTIAIKAGDNAWYEYSSDSTINGYQQYQDGVSADALYFFTAGTGLTQVKVNYIGAIR